MDVFRAAFIGELSLVQAQLGAEPAPLNAEDPPDPIYLAPLIAFPAASGQMGIAQYVLQRSAITLPYSALLLHLAACVGQMDLVQMLLAHDVDARTAGGGIFVSCRDLRILQTLVEHGADVNQPDAKGPNRAALWLQQAVTPASCKCCSTTQATPR